MRRRLVPVLLAIVCVLAGTVVAARPAAADDLPTVSFFNLTARDGTVLKALLVAPKTPGPHPGVVMPSAWGGADFQDALIGSEFARRGYNFLGYATRGFNGSGGTVGTVGPTDVQDAQDAITWLQSNTDTDGRLGMVGQSLAAGIDLLTAAADPRVKAVAAVSAWGSLADAVDQNDTPTDLVVAGLVVSGLFNGQLSAQTQQIFTDLLEHTDDDTVRAWAAQRSPDTYLAGLNRNHPAILLASGEDELVFPTGQTIDFFNQLTGPKRLELRPGDHATAEGAAVLGLHTDVYDSVYNWFDTYVAGDSTAMRDAPDVALVPRSAKGALPIEQAATFAGLASGTRRFTLGARTGADGTAELNDGPTPRTGWLDPIISGFDTTANSGIPLVTFAIEASDGVPPSIDLTSVSRALGAVWESPGLTAPVQLRGRADLHVTVTPTTADGSIFAYLYDVDGTTAYLIGGVPYTWTGKGALQSFPVDLRFQGMGYDVPAGQHLAVVIDTKDILYHDLDTAGAAVIFGSPAGDPSYLDIPVK